MELFALTESAPRIRKVALHRDAQNALKDEADVQLERFMSYEDCYPLDARYRPEDHEIFEIKEFEDLDGIMNAVKSPAGVQSWVPTQEDFMEIKGLFFGVKTNNEIRVGLQIFDKRQIISNKCAFLHGNKSFGLMKKTAFSIDTKIVAVLENKDITQSKDNISLFFRSLHTVRRLFDMDIYFKEATEKDVENFFSDEMFMEYEKREVGDNDIVDNWCRRKIAYILKEGRIKDLGADVLKKQAKELKVDIEFSENENGECRLVFPDDKRGLKKLLRFLDEDIYKSSLSGTIFVAGTKREG
ncbi:hypothetical protein [Zymobacter palmae]|uniref:DNA-directed RNA polymerase, sigma subunit n=1 Tax=Zymobacter palmae TaxID=33074 RepID=A0A348HFP3_9GAMM|nr:hypothetical protein [Zymobacter palmae]BBG30445.1 DNA-directed RNA polymerase, sigma subunit [Zymobacter palmae]